MEEWSPYEAHDLKTIVRICLLRFDLVVSDKTFVHVKHGSARQNFRARHCLRQCTLCLEVQDKTFVHATIKKEIFLFFFSVSKI